MRCKTALADLLTSVHLVITSSVLGVHFFSHAGPSLHVTALLAVLTLRCAHTSAVRQHDREPSLLQQLSSDNKTRALAKFAALQAQVRLILRASVVFVSQRVSDGFWMGHHNH